MAVVPVAALGVVLFTSTALAQASKIAQSEVQLEPTGDTGENDEFGDAVAISANGNTLVIAGEGANGPTVRDLGAVFVFERVSKAWKQTARLVANNAVNEDDFGAAVAVSEDGNTIVVGADGQSGPVNRSGAIYVFQRLNGLWTQTAELFSPAPSVSSGFGFWGLAISGNTIAAGDIGGPANDFAGTVNIYTNTNGTWGLSAIVGVPQNFFFFPNSVGLSGNTLVVGSFDDFIAPGGAAYVFSFSQGTWTQQATLTPSDPTEGSQFGWSVAIAGNLIVVGALEGPGVSPFSGAAYVFAKKSNTWSQVAKLAPGDGVSGDQFGTSVDVNGSTVIVGAIAHTTSGGNGAGAAYLYQIESGTSRLITELSASDGVALGAFGEAVAVRNNTVLVGAAGQHPQIDNGQGYPGGEAYVYRVDD
jgi:hypothetical protein